MSITNYKILSADTTGKKVIDQADTFSGDPDTGKAMFDAIPDVIIDKLNDLIDALATTPQVLTCSVAAATANKGTYSGTFLINGLIYINFEYGNTSSSPTIVLDGDTYTISGLPTVAKISASTYQTYLLKKTSTSTLAFVSDPDYVVEHGTTGSFRYKRMASGESSLSMTASTSTGTLTMTQVSTSGFYVSQDKTLTLPTGVFSGAGYTAIPSVHSSSYVIGINVQSPSCTATSLVFVVNKAGSSTSNVWYRFFVTGNWR